MVKVTSPVTPSVQQPNSFAVAADVRYSPEMFGAQVGRSVAALGAQLQQSNERDERFNSLTAFSDFQTQTQLDFEKSQEDTPVNDGNFFDRTMADYDRASAKFLNSVPPQLQKEFQFRSAQLKQGLAIKAYDFAFKQKGIFYNEKITDALNKAQVGLNQNPNALEPTRKSINDLIDATDLPEIEKEKQKRLANKALEAITYGSAIKANFTSALTSGEGLAATDLPPEAGAVLNAIAGPESGGRYDIRYDGGAGAKITSFADHPRIQAHNPRNGTTSSAAGRYQDIESTWDAITKATGIKDFSPASQDRGNWYWAQKTYRDQTGGDLTEALHAGEYAKIKKALGTQWEGVRTQSLAEFTKNLTSGSGTLYAKQRQIDDDPAFANLPFNERQSIVQDAYKDAATDYTNQLKAIKAQNEKAVNDLYVGLFDGSKGQQDIDNARQQGILSDYDDINKAQEILKKKLSDVADVQLAQEKLDNGSIWDKNDTDDKKAANALFGKEGEAAINNQDEDYVQQTLLPRFRKMEMAAPDLANLLVAQSKLNDPQAAAFAFETLRQMREEAPQAFAAQFPEDTQKKLDQWEVRKNFYSPEELVNQIQGRGIDQATRQSQQMLREQVRKEITDPNSANFIGLNQAARSYTSRIPFNSPSLPLNPRAQDEFLREYRGLVEDAFAQSGDIDAAKAEADKAINRVWTPTSIGGTYHIAKFSPEVAGYQTFNGSYDWIDRSVVEQLPQLKDKTFELLADDETEREIEQSRQAQQDAGSNWPIGSEAPAPVRPSYLVMYKDDNGLQRFAGDENGTPYRIDFAPTKADVAAAESEFNKQQEQADYNSISGRYYAAKVIENQGGPKVPPALEAEFNRMENERIERETTANQQNLHDIFGPIVDRVKKAAQ